MDTSSKFEFDTVFEVDGDGRNIEFDEPKPQFTDEDLAAARGEGQKHGFEAGLQQARKETEAAVATALELIAGQMTAISNTHKAELLSIESDAADLAFTVASKLAPALLAQRPLEEVKALVAECLKMMTTEPRIVIRIADPLIEPLQEKIDQIIAQAGFNGKVVLLAEPSMIGADCRVEWADGGAERDLAALTYRVEDAVARYCASLSRERDEHLATQADEAAAELAMDEALQAVSSESIEAPAEAAPLADEDEDLLSEPLPVLNHIPDIPGDDDGATPISTENPEDHAAGGGT